MPTQRSMRRRVSRSALLPFLEALVCFLAPRRWLTVLLIFACVYVLLLLYHLPAKRRLPFIDGVNVHETPDGRADETFTKKTAKCVPPVLNPYEPSMLQHHHVVGPISCPSDQTDWIYVANGSIRFSHKAQEKHGMFACVYSSILRDGDFAVRRDLLPGPMPDGQPVLSDFFNVRCRSRNGKIYDNLHAAVAWKQAVHDRLAQHAAEKKPSASHSLGLSVFMYGFDSMSRMSWMRNLPKTRDYSVNTLGAVELEGYNIVGDGTPAALLPILTGKMEEELPEARRGFPGATTVDDHPWVWKDFARHGYVTAWAEDMVSVGTFQYRMLGFGDQPTDHYMRPFYLAAEKEYSQNKPFCLGSIPRHVNFMRWFQRLFDTYQPYPKFFFGFHSELSHGGNNDMQAQDGDVKRFLQNLEESGHLNSTLLILMSDHGARFGHIRASGQGKLEERMPYFAFRFPPWFRRQHPDIMRNLEINRRRLTTPFDVHETILEVLKYTGSGPADIGQRAVSLFKEIPEDRSCIDAEITPHWCACLAWETVSPSQSVVLEAVQAAISTINQLTQTERQRCAQLTLSNITGSSRYICTKEDSQAQEKILTYWKQYRNNNFGRFDGIKCGIGIVYFQVSFITEPGKGHFEAISYHNINSRAFKVSDKELSRINKYDNQPLCIHSAHPHLRPYCFCKDQS